MPHFVYILTNYENTVLYTGVTNDINRRLFEHKNKIIPGFTKKYNANKLVYIEEFRDPTDAISAEKKIKGWTRARKIILIETRNPDWHDISMIDPSLRSG